MGIKLRGGMPHDSQNNGLAEVSTVLDEDTSTDVWFIGRASADDTVRHNDTGELTHVLRIQSVEAATGGQADDLQRLHDRMRAARTGAALLPYDESPVGASTGDDEEEARARELAAEQREAQEDAARLAAESAQEPSAPAGEGEDSGESAETSSGVPPAAFSGQPDAAGDEVTPADPPTDLTSRRAAQGRGRRRA
jgi:hypothetical protein